MPWGESLEMSASMSLSMGQSILLSTLAAIALLYVAYFRIWVAIAFASDLLFAVALVAGVTAIVGPGVFDALSRALVERSPLPAALEEADARVAALVALPGELVDRALERLGFEPAPPPAATGVGPTPAANPSDRHADSDADAYPDRLALAPPKGGAPPRGGWETAPTGAIQDTARPDPVPGAPQVADPADAPGLLDAPFTRSILPSVEGLVALILRGATFVASGLLLALSLASRASTTTAKRLRALDERIDALEAQLAALPGAPRGGP